jgi:nucleoside-diphosphate-sugar epimerase
VGEWNEAPWTEDKTPAPQNAYGRSKLAVEALVREAQRDGMHAPILRLPLVYGPGVKANLLNLIAAIDRGWPLPFGGVRNRRSLVARENLLAAIHAVLQAPGAAAGTYFVSDDHDLSSADLCTMIAQGLGRRARLLPVPEPWLHAMGTTGDLLRRIGIPAPVGAAQVQRLVGSLTVSPARLRADTGWVPVVDPASALAATARWYRERHL